MIQFLPVHEANVIAVRMSGKITFEEYQAFLPQLETQIKRYGKISVLIELDEFVGWELAAIKEDFKFALKHSDDIERFAFVGNNAWQHWISLMARPFVSGEVKYFPKEDMHTAWDWVRNKEKPATSFMVKADDIPEPYVDFAEVQLAPYQKILVAVDFSPHSINAAKRAVELAKYYGAELTLLHLVEEKSIYDSYYDPIDMSMMLEEITAFKSQNIASHNEKVRKIGNRRLGELADKIGCSNVKTEILGGNAASGITSYVEAQQTDLVIMGTHGRHGFSRILGSVARSVQASIRCEVLIVPLKKV